MTILTDTRISDCCGATEQTDIPFNSDGGFCSDCRDHCTYIEPELEDNDETPVTFTPSYAEIATVAFIVIAMFVFGVGLNAVEGVR